MITHNHPQNNNHSNTLSTLKSNAHNISQSRAKTSIGNFLQLLLTSAVLIGLWQLVIWWFELPKYLLPTPSQVFSTLIERWDLLLEHSLVTMTEIIAGLVVGALLGISTACFLAYYQRLARFVLPVLLISQAIPVFAIAPLLVLWFGFGFISKLVMTVLIVYFPIASSSYDGINNTPQQYLLLAKSYQISDVRMLFKVRLPSALPAIGSGLRVGATIAPIGAVIGEWVGASKGLGYLMLMSNARMQTDLVFASLCILIIATLVLYFCIDTLVKKMSFETV